MIVSGIVKIKPLSVNKCWQGKRFKTDDYRKYEEEVLLNLKPHKIPDGDLHIILDFGFSNMAADVDNPAKPFIDILQKKFGFNDSRITCLWLSKNKVKKGSEYINFQIKQDVQRLTQTRKSLNSFYYYDDGFGVLTGQDMQRLTIQTDKRL